MKTYYHQSQIVMEPNIKNLYKLWENDGIL